ncbi:redoxin domain-containing protein [Streptomyces sp. TRM43335]|uniref:Redoxin domain-containing protein n=1 Tax=Streptomyces taklimakanensis TaxID=2569853 RepID=A0A6G2BEF5_9ACTN|nr:TlpA disulfide reductase family protein [Streptomyces taklimakanensis]MTE20443.1 redoxin domain-containing protein [Streptomyces taklimakanensis]
MILRATGPRRRPRPSAAVAAAVVGALLLAGCGGEDAAPADGGSGKNYVAGTGAVTEVEPGEREPAPVLSGETVDGERLSTADYRGDVLVVNVWGSWCPPCRAEMPHLVKVAKETEDQGVRFVGINTRDLDRVPAQRFEDDYGVPYPSLYDPSGKLLLRFPKGSLNPQAIPSTLFIDRDGRIAARALKPLGEEELRSILEPLIKEK